MYKGIIFDFNGTLMIDTVQQEEAWNVVMQRHFGRPLRPGEFSGCFHGLSNVDILTYLNRQDPEKQFDISITDEKEEEYRNICRNRPDICVFVPGVETLLNTLKEKGIPFCIATSSEITNVRFYFEVFGLSRWFASEDVIYDNRTFPLKPAPDCYLLSARHLGLSPEECIVCEDSLNGIRAAEAAGIGRIIAANPVLKTDVIRSDPKVYAVIRDFTDFYTKYF